MDKKRILIIDDNINVTKIIKLNLEKTGRYEVRTENEGSQGIRATKEFKPNLILLDIVMPDLPGDELACQLKNNESTKNIPIVFLTALAKEAETKSAKDGIGGHSFIAKPADTKEIVMMIEKLTR